jgi:hypothetical protein
MRKLFTILLIGIFVCPTVIAQNKKASKIKLDWGLRTGVNITHLYITDINDDPVPGYESNWRTGFVLGAFVHIPLHKKIAVETNFLYSSMGGDYTTNLSDHIRARYNYFSIPVLAKYAINNKWTVLAGPQFDFLIQGKETSSAGKFKVSDYLKDHDVLATAGVQYQLSKCTHLQARYMRGFNDIDFRANMRRYYNEGVQVTAGISF